MKAVKKALSLILVLMLALALCAPAFAQTVGTAAEGTGSITINNAARGATYSVYKLYDATVALNTAGESVSIAYSGDIPSTLSSYFTKNATTGEITAVTDPLSADAIAALKAWAEATPGAKVAYATSTDGSPLTFQGLAYGYYVVTTTQGSAAISVTSVNPNASIYDKNTTPPVGNLSKSIDDNDVYIGQTVTYTVDFATASFTGSGETAKRILSYIIEDTPAANSLTDITVTSLIIDGDGDLSTTTDQTSITPAPQFDSNNKITIAWATGNATDGYSSIYANGAKIVLTYTAVVADTAAIAGAGNTNTVKIYYTYDGGSTPGGGGDNETTTATFKTYALAIKKVSDQGTDLSGAVFQLPFYVKSAAASDGAYVYAGTAAGTGLVNTLTTPASGLIVIKGLQSGTAQEFTETAAPDGYNKLAAPFEVTPVATDQTSTSVTVYIDENGNIVDTSSSTTHTVLVSISNIAATPYVVVNKAGTELPSTGGVGTTLFYVIGATLVVGAAVILLARKRTSD